MTGRANGVSCPLVERASLGSHLAPLLTSHQRALKHGLEALLRQTDPEEWLARDPIRFCHRYQQSEDIEVAGAIAAALSFGRVGSFLPVIDTILNEADEWGGPFQWATTIAPDRAKNTLSLQYRWTTGLHIAVFVDAIGQTLVHHKSLKQAFMGSTDPSQASAKEILEAGVGTIRDHAKSQWLHWNPSLTTTLPRGLGHLLPLPSKGSACKRWNMFLRWMCRSSATPNVADGIDLGIWGFPPSRLIIPLDTHVIGLAGLLGFSNRTDGSWRTASEITRNLSNLCPEDPVRYDFALAHLGMSDRCQKRHVAELCGSCPLQSVCRVGT